LNGAPGLAWLYTDWSTKLIESGLNSDDLNQIFINNPAIALKFN
jgi:predicted metal-dependent phosphotriesterase family hydrolase